MSHQQPEIPGARTDNVQVFLCRPDSVDDPTLLQRYFALLDSDERLRLARYRFEREQRVYLISHALVRAALSQFADIPVSAWRFRRNAHGRPEIDHPNPVPLCFSLSQTRDLVACVVTRTCDAGIDVEARSALPDIFARAGHFFAAREMSALRALPVERQSDQFYSIWTLKEAYAKARGLGLSLPLAGIAFQIEKSLIEVSFEREIEDRPFDWFFTLLEPTPGHCLALALRVGEAPLPKITSQWLLPLRGPTQGAACPIVAATPGRSRGET